VENIKMLGFYINNGNNIEQENFGLVSKKIENTIRYWTRFKLSIIGRITIVKTLILPHVAFVGSVLHPGTEWLATQSEKIEKFVLDNQKVAKEKLYKKVEEGGLGLIELDKFITAIQCTWMQKAIKNINDCWKFSLWEATDAFTKFEPNLNYGRTLNQIISSFEKFKTKFYLVNNNFLHERISNNAKYGYGNRMQFLYNDEFFNADTGTLDKNSLTWQSLLKENKFDSHNNLKLRFGMGFSNEKYLMLKQGWEYARKKFSARNGTGTSAVTGTNILSYIKQLKLKGSSKRLRFILNNGKEKNISRLPQVTNYKKITGISTDHVCNPVNWLMAWNQHYFTVEVRDFLYKFYNNTLPINCRVGHFSGDGEKGCTFCIMSRTVPECRETIQHLFFDCVPVKKVWSLVCNNFLRPGIPVTRSDFFSGRPASYDGKNELTFQLLCDLFRFLVWELKLLKKLPVPATFLVRLNKYLRICTGISAKINNMFENNNLLANVQAIRR
jgi:hypothetical protein